MYYGGYYGMYWDPTYILVIIGMVICLLASARVKSTYAKFNRVRSHSGITAAEAAEKILHGAGIYDVEIRHISGDLTDNYDPSNRVLNLSDATFRSSSVAAIGVAAHECGHAIHLVGMNGLKDQTLADMIRKAYQHASDNGLWPDTYAISNYEEYFATLSTVWFNVMQEGVDGRWDGIRGPVNTREELKVYDPEGYELMKHIYPEKTLPEPWHYNVNIYDIDGKPYKSYDENMKFNWDFIQ